MKLSKLLNLIWNSELNIAVETEGVYAYKGKAENVPFNLSRRNIVSVETNEGKLFVTVASEV